MSQNNENLSGTGENKPFQVISSETSDISLADEISESTKEEEKEKIENKIEKESDNNKNENIDDVITDKLDEMAKINENKNEDLINEKSIQPITEQIHTNEPEFIAEIEGGDNENNSFDENSSNNEKEQQEKESENEKSKDSISQNSDLEEKDLNNDNAKGDVKEENSERKTENENNDIDKKPKKKISNELAAFLSDMPFGLGDDLNQRAEERPTKTPKSERPNLPPAKDIKKENKENVYQTKNSTNPAKQQKTAPNQKQQPQKTVNKPIKSERKVEKEEENLENVDIDVQNKKENFASDFDDDYNSDSENDYKDNDDNTKESHIIDKEENRVEEKKIETKKEKEPEIKPQEEKKASPLKPKLTKKIIQPKPKSALDEALDLFSNPTPFTWQKNKDSANSNKSSTSSLSSTKNRPKQTVKQQPVHPKPQPKKETHLPPDPSLTKKTTAATNTNTNTNNTTNKPMKTPQKTATNNQPSKPQKTANYSKPRQQDPTDLSAFYPSSTTNYNNDGYSNQKRSKTVSPVKHKPRTNSPRDYDGDNYQSVATDVATETSSLPDQTTFVTSVSNDKTYHTKAGQDSKYNKQFEDMRIKYLNEEKRTKTTRSNKNKGQKRMTYAMMSFLGPPPMPSYAKQVDLSRYDGLDDSFNPDDHLDEVPELLLELIAGRYPSDSLVFHVICGSTLPDINKQSVISKVASDLKKLMNETIKKGYITESAYLEDKINKLKEAHSSSKPDAQDPEELKNRMEQANEQLERIDKRVDDKLKQIDVEEMQAMFEFEEKFKYEEMKLDEDWNSEKMQNKFNKPSAKLIALRNEARVNLAAHRFNDAILIANEIAQLEEIETDEASKKMGEAYKTAVQKFEQKYNHEKEQISNSFEMKRQRCEQEREHLRRPVISRMEKLNTQITQIEKEKERAQRQQVREQTLRGIQNVNNNKKKGIPQCPPIVLDGKLKLPPLTTNQKPRTKSSLSGTSTQ